VDLTWDLEPHLPRLVADRIQVQQVISNLVRNAIEAMEGLDDRTRRLHIAARSYENNTLLIQVQDNGMGIEDADRIFEPFFTTKPNGMGVGLSICRWIIEAHAGRLWAAHNDHDLGTTFSLLLPLEIKKPLDTSKEEQ
jgi:signal transduction histidine kinase